MTRLSGTRLGAWRIKNGFLLAVDAAKRARCSRLHLLAIESGHKNPSPELFLRLLPVYGKTADQLRRGIKRARLDMLHGAVHRINKSP